MAVTRPRRCPSTGC